MSRDFGMGVSTSLTFEQAVARTRIALRAHGFGVLSEMKAPPSVGEFPGRSHLFMGMWERLIESGNLGGPGLDVGDHLACNVVVYEEEGSATVVALDPVDGLEGWESADLANQARVALERMLAQVAGD